MIRYGVFARLARQSRTDLKTLSLNFPPTAVRTNAGPTHERRHAVQDGRGPVGAAARRVHDHVQREPGDGRPVRHDAAADHATDWIVGECKYKSKFQKRLNSPKNNNITGQILLSGS